MTAECTDKSCTFSSGVVCWLQLVCHQTCLLLTILNSGSLLFKLNALIVYVLNCNIIIIIVALILHVICPLSIILFFSMNVCVCLGEVGSGKTALVAKLQGVEEFMKGRGLEYLYFSVHDDDIDGSQQLLTVY